MNKLNSIPQTLSVMMVILPFYACGNIVNPEMVILERSFQTNGIRGQCKIKNNSGAKEIKVSACTTHEGVSQGGGSAPIGFFCTRNTIPSGYVQGVEIGNITNGFSGKYGTATIPVNPNGETIINAVLQTSNSNVLYGVIQSMDENAQVTIVGGGYIMGYGSHCVFNGTKFGNANGSVSATVTYPKSIEITKDKTTGTILQVQGEYPVTVSFALNGDISDKIKIKKGTAELMSGVTTTLGGVPGQVEELVYEGILTDYQKHSGTAVFQVQIR